MKARQSQPALAPKAPQPTSEELGFSNAAMLEELQQLGEQSWGADLGGVQLESDDGLGDGTVAQARGDTVVADPLLGLADTAFQEHVLLHELAHIAQKRNDGTDDGPDDGTDLEAEADGAAEAALSGAPFAVQGSAAAATAQSFDFPDWERVSERLAADVTVGERTPSPTYDEHGNIAAPSSGSTASLQESATAGGDHSQTRTHRIAEADQALEGERTVVHQSSLTDGTVGMKVEERMRLVRVQADKTRESTQARLTRQASTKKELSRALAASADEREQRVAKTIAKERERLGEEATEDQLEDILLLEAAARTEAERERAAAAAAAADAAAFQAAADGLSTDPKRVLDQVRTLQVTLADGTTLTPEDLGLAVEVEVLAETIRVQSDGLDFDLFDGPGASWKEEESVEVQEGPDGARTTSSSSSSTGVRAKDGKVVAERKKQASNKHVDADGNVTSETRSSSSTLGYDAQNEQVVAGHNRKRSETVGEGDNAVTRTSETNIDGAVGKDEARGSITHKNGVESGDESAGAKATAVVSADGGCKVSVKWDKKLGCWLVTATVDVSATGGFADLGGKGKSSTGAAGGFGVGATGTAGLSYTIVRRTDKAGADRFVAELEKAGTGNTSSPDLSALDNALLALDSTTDLAMDMEDPGLGRTLQLGESQSSTSFVGGEVSGKANASMGGFGVGVNGSAGGRQVRTLSIGRVPFSGQDMHGNPIGGERVQLRLKLVDESQWSAGGELSAGVASGGGSHTETSSAGVSVTFEVSEQDPAYDELYAAVAACDSAEELEALSSRYAVYRSQWGRSRSQGTEDTTKAAAGPLEINGHDKRGTAEDVVFSKDGLDGSTASGFSEQGTGGKAGELVQSGSTSRNDFVGTVTAEGLEASLIMTDTESTSALGGLWTETKKELSQIDLDEGEMRVLVGRAREKDRWTSKVHDHTLLDDWETLRRRLRNPDPLITDEERAHAPEDARWLGRARALATFTSQADAGNGRIVFRKVLDEWGMGQGPLGTTVQWGLASGLVKEAYAQLQEEVPAVVKRWRQLLGAPDLEAHLESERTTRDALLERLKKTREMILGDLSISDLRAQADMGAEMAALEDSLREAWSELSSERLLAAGASEEGVDELQRRGLESRLQARRETCEAMLSRIDTRCDAARAEYDGDGVFNLAGDSFGAHEEIEDVPPLLVRLEAEWRRCLGLMFQLELDPARIREHNAEWGYRAAKERYDDTLADIDLDRLREREINYHEPAST